MQTSITTQIAASTAFTPFASTADYTPIFWPVNIDRVVVTRCQVTTYPSVWGPCQGFHADSRRAERREFGLSGAKVCKQQGDIRRRQAADATGLRQVRGADSRQFLTRLVAHLTERVVVE